MYKYIVKPLLFLLPPEKAHYFSIAALKLVLSFPFAKLIFKKLFTVNHHSLQFTKKGLKFPNRIGLAAGFDKNASFYKDFKHLGFGFIEVGTVTPIAQLGNPKPRLFRLPKDKALINRMGFNNDGVDQMVRRLKTRPKDFIIGGNIGKNKNTSEENALNDYMVTFRKLYHDVDYFAVNVSSPNTPGLRNLQDKKPLMLLLSALKKEATFFPVYKPILLKISPDLSAEAIIDIANVIKDLDIDGVIATNTTIYRNKLKSSQSEIDTIGAGGLSGKPLKEVSTYFIKRFRELLGESFLIIGVGGIHSAADAMEKLNAGADLVQLYTGFVYKGPSLIKKINKALIRN